MPRSPSFSKSHPWGRYLRAVEGAACAALLTACGGGGDTSTPTVSGAAVEASPVYRLTPALIDEPAATDGDGHEGSAVQAPWQVQVEDSAVALSTDALSPQALAQTLQTLSERRTALAAGGQAKPQASSVTAIVYTPAQIRAAYGLAALPAASSASRGAYQGAGQTIYIVDAYHNPNMVADLAAFNLKFGLPTCTTVNVPVAASLPLAAAAADAGCTLSVVYAAKGSTTSVPSGALTATVPAVNKSWVTEIALDVQWAHAIAPLARIVLIEAQSASVPDLMSAVALANRMGPGVVSMSFGAGEFGAASMAYWGTPLGGASMSYVAANGDYGSQVNWPAVDPRVLAVGGTRLSWNGTVRSETAWTSTGGATSTQVLAPAYQATLLKPGDSSSARVRYRGSADVAFNADPYSGQYVYVTPSSVTGGTGWLAAGGTSIGAPQWAGLLAIGNAVRALSGKAVLGAVHTRLYASATGSGYATLFADVVSGSNGSCGAMCNAATGYDLLTGWGSPKGVALVGALAGY